MKNNNARKQKALLILPLVVIPFVTLAFWVMGGGKDQAKEQIDPSGLNMQLPGAHLKDDKGENKLGFYDEAEKDSERIRQEIKSDPLFQTAVPKDTGYSFYGHKTFDLKPGDYKDSNEEKVYARLAELNQQLNNNANTTTVSPEQPKVISVKKEDVDRLEGLMQHVNDDSGRDPEIEQLNGMMDKILDIQHPERVKPFPSASAGQAELKVTTQLLSVSRQSAQASIGLIDTIVKKDTSAGFYGLEPEIVSEKQNAIEAVVHENQVLVSGSVIKLRLLNDITIDGTTIPKDNFVFGTSSLNGERLKIEIHSIRYGHSLFPVNMEVFDMDGLPGIYIPGAITRDVIKQSSDNGLQAMDMTSIDPTLKAQAAAAGINAAKTLLSKKAKLVRVYVKAGYKILLKNKNIQQQ
ncbi:conjugative transposon protein TraM [Ginsengibacter hankyongi]|uniref:Conjugative transposon protein TraM n=1 Tax=Ginsengibacter hankyongi TaxID=2607284 RepID=A0A5J5IFN5_9BACT|nr:conjugative transposon protein TraM [Ginsengibacter hankyongi]KAA9038692.1 conjugative transposon protein TraM [Ginsengibacter hankyongi]